MDHLFIISYSTTTTTIPITNKTDTKRHSTPSPPLRLSQVRMKRLNPDNQFQYSQTQITKYVLFNNQTNEKQSTTRFKQMLRQIIKLIHELNQNFVNVTLICQNIEFFETLLPKECQRYEISLPSVLMMSSYIDIMQIIRFEYKCPYKDLKDVAKYLNVNVDVGVDVIDKCCGSGQLKQDDSSTTTTDIQRLLILQKIIKKVYSDKLIQDSQTRFKKQISLKNVNNNMSNNNLYTTTTQTFFNNNNNDYIKTQTPTPTSTSTPNLSKIPYRYFKIIGLPFRIFQPEVLDLIAGQIPQNQKQVAFIWQKQKFSGKAIIKIPERFQKQIVSKNRMYIGKRYIELQGSSLEQFQKAKISKQLSIIHSRQVVGVRNQKKYQSRRLEGEERGRGDDGWEIRIKATTNQQSSLQQRGTFNSNNLMNNNNPYQQDRNRSRQNLKNHHHQEHEQPQQHNNNSSTSSFITTNHYCNDFNLNNQQSGIKVRGIPFSFTQWDVQNIFRFYNIIGGSVKLGIKSGTNLKNGQAVILTRSYNDSQKALQMDGFRCMGRYLEVKVITKEQYMRYR